MFISSNSVVECNTATISKAAQYDTHHCISIGYRIFTWALFVNVINEYAITGLAGPLLILLVMQTLTVVILILLILFKLMGKDYQAAVLSAGFGGFALGDTPTAIANMTAVTKANGPAP